MEREPREFEPIERRRQERGSAKHLRFWHPAPGQILNFSRDGMAVRVYRELQVGEEYLFKLRYHADVVTLTGTTRWVRSEDGSQSVKVFVAGLGFLDGRGDYGTLTQINGSARLVPLEEKPSRAQSDSDETAESRLYSSSKNAS